MRWSTVLALWMLSSSGRAVLYRFVQGFKDFFKCHNFGTNHLRSESQKDSETSKVSKDSEVSEVLKVSEASSQSVSNSASPGSLFSFTTKLVEDVVHDIVSDLSRPGISDSEVISFLLHRLYYDLAYGLGCVVGAQLFILLLQYLVIVGGVLVDMIERTILEIVIA